MEKYLHEKQHPENETRHESEDHRIFMPSCHIENQGICTWELKE